MQSKNILIVGLEKKNDHYIITDQDGAKFTFFEKKQTGDYTKAYQFMINKAVKAGDNYKVTFKQNGKYKNILWFDEIDNPTAKQAERPAVINEAPPFQTKNEQISVKEREEKKQNEIARGKVRHAFSVEAYKMGLPLNSSTTQLIDNWVDYVMTGQLSANVDTDMSETPPVPEVEKPTVDISDVPF